jgi:hypothetical protein
MVSFLPVVLQGGASDAVAAQVTLGGAAEVDDDEAEMEAEGAGEDELKDSGEQPAEAAVAHVDEDLRAAPQQEEEEAEREEPRRSKKRKTDKVNVERAHGRRGERHKLKDDLSSLPLEEQERLALRLLGD